MSAARSLLAGHPAEVAPRLLGAQVESDLLNARVRIRLTEVEAYGGVGEDPGSHAFRRMTPRNATMFGRAGLLYVYFTYGMHHCANIVTGPQGSAGAVLLRAGEVVEGADAVRRRRPSARADRDLARGPARLATALGLDLAADGLDLLDPASPVRLFPLARRRRGIASSPRTGVAGPGAPTPWRFVLEGEPTVSPYRPARPRAGG